MNATITRFLMIDPVGRPRRLWTADNFMERQAASWRKQYRASETEPIEAMERLIVGWRPARARA